MRNHDESILRARAINPAAPFPALHQALRIVLYDRFAARSFYTRVIESFGARAPFEAALRRTEQQIAALAAPCQRFGVPRPLDPFPSETTVAPGWRVNCERALAGEIACIQLCDRLLPHASAPAARRVLLEIRATALERHLPAFRQAALDAIAQERYHAAHGIPPQQAYVRHGAVSDLLEKVFAQLGSHAGPLGVFSPFLRRLHPAMLAGMALGGAGVHLLKNRSGRTSKEK